MSAAARPAERLALRLLTAADALGDRLYSQRFNPLYQSGTIVVALYLVLIVTGLWLILFYRIGAPWESVARLTADPWVGNWMRTVHRYASDLAVVATAVHAFRMFAQGRTWGARALAWVTGCVLLLLLLVCGWTGYVMVWDTFGQQLAREGARMIDALPILSEPTGRAFTGEQPVPTVFFFINLFAHIGIPLAAAVVFWLHVKRLNRPRLLPSRPLTVGLVAALLATSLALPLTMSPEADAFALPSGIRADLFYAFWLPVARATSGAMGLALAVTAGCALLMVTWLTARRGSAVPPPSVVDEDICVGCVQCSIDCPYGAIEMVERDSRRSDLVARVDPSLCVSCGICAGSCAPMGVGPSGRTGRDQVADVRAFLAEPARRAGEIVAICCEYSAAPSAAALAGAGVSVYPVACAGNLHTSVVELLLRGGVSGVAVLACPPRDCRHREGPRWLVARVRVVHADRGDDRAALEIVRAFAAEVRTLDEPAVGDDEGKEPRCEPALVEDDR